MFGRQFRTRFDMPQTDLSTIFKKKEKQKERFDMHTRDGKLI